MSSHTPRRRHRAVEAMMAESDGTSASPPSSSPARNPNFVDVDKLQNSSGIVAIISQRKDGTLSCAFFREWVNYDPVERKEKPARGAFIPQRLMRAYAEMVEMAAKRMDDLAAAGTLPFPVVQ